MLKRVFKTIFILSLCLIISLPANAGSVAVSDGSAFITKAELSYRLNNLSSRMTQLENSLDSKIDQLVSSYLTRNGIWNGVAQTLNSYHGLNTNFTNAKIRDIYRGGLSVNVNQIVDGVSGSRFVLVQKTSKGGLVNVTASNTTTGIAIGAVSNMKGRNFQVTNNTGSTWSHGNYFRDLVRYSGGLDLVLYVNDNIVYTKELMTARMFLEEGNTTETGYYSCCYNLSWNPTYINAYFFCNKEDTIYWLLRYHAMYGEVFVEGSGFTSADIRGSNHNFKINSCSIY